MSEQQSGLRFDIYERVHLADTVAIQELDGVELIPEIRVSVEGEQAVIRGSLRLIGEYVGQSDDGTRSPQTFEHTIPVEITLPMSRIRSIDQVSVEIDNFDIDLLSARSLNVTGVLSLHGIDMEQRMQEPWQEMVFVHEPEKADEQQPNEEPAIEAQAEAEQELPEEKEAQAVSAQPEEPPDSGFFREDENQQSAAATASNTASLEVQPEKRKRDELPEHAMDDFEALDEDSFDAPEEVPASAPVAAPSQDEEAETADMEADGAEQASGTGSEADKVQAAPDKGEMKIAFGSKKDGDESPADLKTFLGKSPSRGIASGSAGSAPTRNEAETIQDSAPSDRNDQTDAVEWKKLFLSANESQQFKKVRLCIVHKDDTLESIAEKYGKKPQELRLCNGLNDQDITEGQVLYIP
jgi:stage VI sporulation protein D